MCSFVFLCAILFLSSASLAAGKCSAEVKVLLSPQMVQTVIRNLQFDNEVTGQLYYFDTDQLDLLKQGVIVRVRQGANNDVTVKVRIPENNKHVDATRFQEHFPCETNRTGAGEDTDYLVRHRYKAMKVPETGRDISSVFTLRQKRLLQETGVSIEWGRVKRIAEVKLRKWEAPAQLPFRKLTLELWDWRTGNILELSTKIASDAGPSNYAELRRLADAKGLSLSPTQGAKTSIVLETLTNHARPPR
jgi:hypothetical protein